MINIVLAITLEICGLYIKSHINTYTLQYLNTLGLTERVLIGPFHVKLEILHYTTGNTW